MRLVRNPSHKHPKEIKDEFIRNSAYIFDKDHSKYSEEDIKKLFLLLSITKPLGLDKEEIKWLSMIIKKDNPTIKAIKEDYIPSVVRYSVKTFEKGFTPIARLNSLSEVNETLRENSDVQFTGYEDLNIFYEFDGWFIAMPLSKAASCMLGKGTDWCTSRDYDNLFFYYCSDQKNDRILFYVINTNGNPKKNPNDKISISVRNGKIDLNEYKEEGETVNAKQKPISFTDLEEIFGSERTEEILKVIKEKAADHRFIHPIKDECSGFIGEIEDVYKIREKYYSEDEQEKVEKALARLNSGMSDEVFEYFLGENFLSELDQNEYLTKEQKREMKKYEVS